MEVKSSDMQFDQNVSSEEHITVHNVSAEICDTLDSFSQCPSFPTFTQRFIDPFLQDVKRMLHTNIATAQQATSTGIDAVVGLMNTIPKTIRTNTLFTSKYIAANMHALGDVVSSAADRKDPPVTKDNMAIMNFLAHKQPDVFAKMAEVGENIKDEPLEKRAYVVLMFSNDIIKPSLVKLKST